MKFISYFLWLMLLLSSFIKPCWSQNADNQPSAGRAIPQSQPATGLSFQLGAMKQSVSSLKNTVDINKENIKKNALDISNVNVFHKQQTQKLNVKTDKNRANINNIYKKLKTDETNISSNVSTILKNTESTKLNESAISINKRNIASNNQLFSQQAANNDNYKADIEEINKKFKQIKQTYGLTNDYLDRFWVLLAAVLVFFMQAGFKTLEAGMVRKAHDDNVAIKNILDWLVISLVYFFIGFGLMFGDSQSGFIGNSLFAPTLEVIEQARSSIKGQYLGLEFFLYQLAFAATAATIVSGAISERVALIPYIVLSFFIGTIIYPVFGHWAWGGAYTLSNHGWLYTIGFRDFAGSTVVHSIGAWVALAGVMEIGARHGRFDKNGNLNSKDFTPSNLGYSTLGVLILWFGWWGFNGGSQLKYDENTSVIIVNTILSGSAAGMTAFFHALSKSRDKYEIFPKLLGGILGGLVAITACCNVVSTWEACLIGVAAGFIHNYSYDFLLLKLKLDDPVGAIAVHGFCGVWGTLCVAFFGDLNTEFFAQNSQLFFSENSLMGFLRDASPRIKQLIFQLIGIAAAFVYSFSLSIIFFKLIRLVPGVGLRVLPADEKTGSLLGVSN